MRLSTQTPKFVLNKAFLKQRPLRSEIELFKANLKTLLSKVEAKESEEHKKNHVRDFLLDTYYKDKNEINTKDRKDLVIHLDKTRDSKVGVIIEAKTPDSPDRVKPDKLNVKAFHELVLYYFDERHTKNNSELKNLIVTNTYEWFIFDANVFDKQIYRNPQIKRLYETYKNDKKDNPFFYEELRKILKDLSETIECTHFNLKDYETFLNNADLEDDRNLIELYKILSPFHLLKVPFANDSNALNKPFYDELLHIIGLEEIKDKSKTIIQRKDEARRNAGSLLENTITLLKTKDSLRRVKDIANYGAESEERYFNVALELCLTWINRILFLKLLESQLVIYHKGNRDYRFLNFETIPEFDELFTLFHQVLARTFEDREGAIKEKYKRVPYLNSSLFEQSDLEEQTITIESLKDSAQLPFINSTVLRDLRNQGRTLNTLEYLFKFLDAYDFASEGVEDIQADNRSLINASVLGKVFEKINGYKDGSIFTPGFITMYMCRQAIRLAVVQKFKDRYEIDIETFDDLKNFVGNVYKTEKIKEYNELINEIRLCDPAVGSGHFLVSSLNEIIAIKSELGILADEKGIRLSDFEIQIENDELIITDEDGDIFEYQINADGKPTAKAQRLQKVLFHEKQTLIENCLFGVDINPNSVKICRLRLWIELLKNAYYKESSGFAELETLPNIDINIKQGNSLLSRFKLQDRFRSEKINRWISEYSDFVNQYKNEKTKERKMELKANIDNFHSVFSGLLEDETSKLRERLNKKIYALAENQNVLFAERNDVEKEIATRKLKKEIADLESQIALINSKYNNSFEWRFEFPEVLDNEGNFLGFDVVIGNPPYIRHEILGKLKDYLKKDYKVFAGTADILVYFYELGLRLLKPNGKFSFITSNKFMRANYGKALRIYLWKLNLYEIIDFGELPVFDEVATFPVIVNLTNGKNAESVRFTQVKTLKFDSLESLIKETSSVLSASAFSGENWTLADSQIVNIIEKVKKIGVPLKDYLTDCDIYYGIKTGFNEAFVINEEKRNELIAVEPEADEFIKPFIIGDDIRKWNLRLKNRWLIYIPWHFPLHKEKIEGASKTAELEFQKQFPKIYQHLEQYKPQLKARNKAETDIHYEWYALQRFGSTYWKDFNKPKIIFPDIAKESRMTFVDYPLYMGNTVYFIPTADKYLLAVLNSKLIFYYFSKFAAVLGDAEKGGRLRFFRQDVEKIPIKKITPEKQKSFIKLVDEILEKKKLGQETADLENKIDAMVYRLYDLTTEEIAIVEG